MVFWHGKVDHFGLFGSPGPGLEASGGLGRVVASELAGFRPSLPSIAPLANPEDTYITSGLPEHLIRWWTDAPLGVS
jgi:hypothetical protein